MRLGAAGLLLLLWAAPAQAQKTDSVYIRNGDRITGEVKSLLRGLLKYSTDDLGTISIEWDKVDRISTKTLLEVQLRSGQKFYGRLGLGPSGWLVLGTDTLPLARIVTIIPIDNKFLGRVNGYVDLGFSYQKANKTVQLSTGARVVYRGRTTETAFDLSTFLEDRDDASQTSRLSSSLTGRLLFSNRWSAGVVLGYDNNEELDLSGRGRIVGFATRTLAQTNHLEFRATGGLVGTRERYFSSDSTTYGMEGLIGAAFRAFRYDRPKLDASIASSVYPSFTVGGRVRMQNDLRVSYELLSDFMLTMTLFDAFDSKPQSVGAPKNDFGTTLGVTWTF